MVGTVGRGDDERSRKKRRGVDEDESDGQKKKD